jgi:hypothetical protein
VDELPAPVRDFVSEHECGRRFIAYLGVKADGEVASWGGDLPRCGVADVTSAPMAAEVAPFLVGLLPLRGESFHVPCAQVRPGAWADIHVISAAGLSWIVILDCSDVARALQLRQQYSNELALQRETGARTAADRCPQREDNGPEPE